jgi:hypothetical protein
MKPRLEVTLIGIGFASLTLFAQEVGLNLQPPVELRDDPVIARLRAESEPCPNFLSYLQRLVSDEQWEAATSERRATDCFVPLLSEDKTYLESNILPIVVLGLQSQEPRIRVHAAGIPAFLSMFRQDGAIVLENFVPALLDHFTDPDPHVAGNAVLAVTNLRPEPPAMTTQRLIELLDKRRFRSNAFVALARISPMTERVAERLTRELAEETDPIAKGNLLNGLGAVGDLHPAIAEALISALDSPHDYVVEKSVFALFQLGSKAEEAAPRLRQLSEDPRISKSVANLAGRAADRAEGKSR